MCLRIAGALNNVAGQVGVFVQGTSAAVTCFSRAVSVHTGEHGFCGTLHKQSALSAAIS